MSIWNRFRHLRRASRRSRSVKKQQRRRLFHESLEARELLTFGDVVVDFRYLDSGGNPVNSLQVGQDFTLQANIRDGQPVPEGVLRAYFDFTYPAAVATVQGTITHGASYNLSTSGTATTPGLIDEVGGLDSDAFPPSSPGDSFLLFSLPMRAAGPGTFTLTPDAADGPTRDVRLFDFASVPLNEVQFVNTTIEVVGAGISVTPTTGLVTTEAGGTDTFAVVLTSQPTANVTINLSSSDTSEGTVSPTSLTFTPSNWDTPRTVTVTGVNDQIDDGNVSYTIVTAPATSSDQDFNGVNASDVTVTNMDDADTAGITVTASNPLTTSEPATQGNPGTTTTFQIVLDSQPTGNVTIPVSSNDTTEGTVNVTSVVFTPQNWNVARTVTVTGVDDSIADGDITYSIILGSTTSSDALYNGLNPADLPALNLDAGDAPGFLIQPTSGLVTTETGGTATFQVRLTSQPNTNVTLGLSSSDTTEGTVSPTSLTFTNANWNVFQTVTITGVDDDIADGNVAYSIITAAATGDSAYAGINPPDVSVTNNNVGDSPGFTVSPTSGLLTSESGQSATFTIRLSSRPTANVTIPLSSSDLSEGTVSPTSVTFTPQNWNINRSITVTGVNDSIDDGTVAYEIVTGAATSTDTAYSGLNPANVMVSNLDDSDTASIILTPNSGLTTTEAGGTAPLAVRLGSQPTANVQIQLASTDSSEGTVSPATLTFTPGNWNVNQNVTVTGVNDDVRDGNISYSITATASSSDQVYNNLAPVSASATNTDNDVVGVIVDPTSGLTTTEDGGTAQFTVRLRSQPTANVTIPLSSSDTTEGTVSPASLTFTSQNWNVARVVTVTGVSDLIADSNIAYQIITGPATSNDSNYSGFNAADVSVVNTNTGPTAGFNITPTSGLTVSEDGPTSATFQISLTSQPVADVTINLASSDTTEGTVSPATVTFNAQNWNVPRTVTINGVDDPQSDGDVPFTIQTSVTSQDPAYAGLDPQDVSVVNINDDPLAITVTPATGLETTESGTTTSFAVALTSQPTANVTINLASNNIAEGTLSTSSVTFTPQNWDTPQNVTVTGVEDEIVDGDQSFMIVTSPAVSSDPNYNGFDPPDVSLINRDDDSATLTISAMLPSQNEGDGGSTTDFVFQVELSRAVTGGFDVSYTTNDGTATAADNDYVDNDGVLTFEGAKCEIRTITVQANNDNKVETDETFEVVLGQLSNIPAGLANRISFAVAQAAATITNDDTANLLLTPVSSAVQEGTGGTSTTLVFDVSLTAPVQGGFDVGYTVNDGTATVADGDYVDNDGTLTFDGTENEQRTITVTINQDGTVEADETFVVALQGLSNIAASLAGSINVDTETETGTILNDDTASLTIASVTESQLEGSDGQTTEYRFDVMLSNAVQGGFDVAYSTNDDTATLADGDYVDNDGVLSFAGNANEVQTITVLVNQDLQIEPDELFQVMLGELSGADAEVLDSITISGSPATATIENDDVPRLILAAVESSIVEGPDGNGAVFTFTVTLSDDIDDPDGFDVTFATVDGTATVSNGDYSANTGTLHFNGTAGEVRTFTVNVTADSIVEGNETFHVELGDATGLESGITVLTNGSPLTATILNDDTSTISVSPLTTSANEGTGTANTEFAFEIMLSNAVQGGFGLDFATADGTATVADGDYVANTGTLSFVGNAGETQTVTVVVNPDSKVEADEVLQLVLQALNAADTEITNSITLSDAAVMTIINDDTAELVLTPINNSQNEGTDGTTTDFTFQVRLTNDVQGGLSVAFNTNDGTATTADSDYVDNDGVLTFSGNADETRIITVQVNHDQQIEPDESFNVSLGAITQLDPTAADDVTISGSPVEAAIINDDFPRLVVSSAVVSQPENSEGGNTEFVITVMLSDAVADADGFDVTYSTADGTATVANGDYTANNGTLHFTGTAGESQTVTILVNSDDVVEADETFSFLLGEISGLAEGETVVFDGSPISVTIVNDDTTTLSLTPVDVSQSEGSSGATTDFTFNVTLSNAVQGGFTVGYVTTDGSAVAADGDYVDNDGTLTFMGSAGETQTITVQVNHDNLVELDEAFQVALGMLGMIDAAVAGNITVDDVAEVATILNDDTTTLTISSFDATVTEGTGTSTTNASFVVTLSNPVQGGFQIGYVTNDGTATVAGNDYTDNDGSLSFSGTLNETQTVNVQIRQDSLVERNENFTFNLTQLSGIDATLAQSITVNMDPREVSIVNDDTATVSFVNATSSVPEADGTHTVEVILNVANGGSLSEAVVVNIAALPTGTATTPEDFTLNTTSVTFAAGSQNGARQTISLTLQDDDLMEEQETINLQLSLSDQNIAGAVTAGSSSHVVTVTDDPMTGVVSGRVWADTNNNGIVDDSELMIPGVTVRLSGQNARGQMVEIETMTAEDGSYTFDQLPGGTYRVTEVQPAAFHDGQEVLGTVGGTTVGQAGADQFTGITIEPAQQATGYNFAEVSLRSQYVNSRFFLASATQQATMLRGYVAAGEESAGNSAQAAVIRSGAAVEVRRIGSQVTVTGTNRQDVVNFIPANSTTGGSHTVEANGVRWTFPANEVDAFSFHGAGGNDMLRLDDSSGDEDLTATRDTAIVSTDNYHVEATGFELVRAVSDSGGQDEAANTAAAVDFILRLEGNWLLP